MMETLNKIKLAVVGIAGAITAVFGWMGWLVIGFAACMLLDWITGSVAGSKKDGWSSATARADPSRTISAAPRISARLSA